MIILTSYCSIETT